MWELQPQICISGLISPSVLSIPQSSMVRGQGYLRAAAAGEPSQSHLSAEQFGKEVSVCGSWSCRRDYSA